MAALSIIRQSNNAQLLIELPDQLVGKQLKVIIVATEDLIEGDVSTKSDISDERIQERLKIIKEFVGKAKYPNFFVNDLDVYNQ